MHLPGGRRGRGFGNMSRLPAVTVAGPCAVSIFVGLFFVVVVVAFVAAYHCCYVLFLLYIAFPFC